MGALSLGASCGLASSPLGWHLVQWVALLPLLWAWDGLDRRASLLAGLCAGFGVNLALFSWLGPSTMDYAGLSPGVAALALVAFLCWEALPFAILGLVDWAGRRRWPGARWLVFPCALMLLEWLWPRLFGWTLGTPQVNANVVAQCADLVGPYGLSGLVAFVNVALYQAWRGESRRPAGAAALLLVAVLGYGVWQQRRWGEPARAGSSAPSLRVGWVQPNRVLNDRRRDTPEQVWEALREGVASLESCDLIVLPEGVVPAPLMIPAEGLEGLDLGQASLVARTHAGARGIERELRRLAQRAPLLAGVTRRVVRPLDGERLEILRRQNAVLLVGAEGQRDWVAKRRLLPLAEYLPGERALPALRRALPFAGRFEPGPRAPVLELGSTRIGVLICYEAVWPRPLGSELPDLWVNPTNDVWFRGQGPALHAMISRLRAIESRRCLVRATTTGISYVLDPAGRTIAGAGRDRAAAGTLALRLPREVPLYPRVGDWPAWLAALVVLLLARAGYRPALEEPPPADSGG